MVMGSSMILLYVHNIIATQYAHNRMTYFLTGGIPYPGIDIAAVADIICSGGTMEVQKGSNKDMLVVFHDQCYDQQFHLYNYVYLKV